MIFFVAVLFLLIISGAEFSKPNEFNKDYISRAGTTAIKGIFVILIMFSHGKGYIDVGGKFDVPYLKMQDHLNQMIVAMFMFYSGYGIMESIKKKGSAYIDTIPKKRFPQVLLNMEYCRCSVSNFSRNSRQVLQRRSHFADPCRLGVGRQLELVYFCYPCALCSNIFCIPDSQKEKQ